MSTKTARLRGAKVVSALLALAMALALTPAAPRAAWGDNESSTASNYTISNGSSAITYDVYQIFTGDYSTNDKKGVLANVKWGQNGTGTKGEKVESAVLAELESVNTNDKTDVEKLAVIEKYFNSSSTVFGTLSAGGTLSAAPGYYLLKDVTNHSGTTDYTRGLYVVEIVGNVTVNPKSEGSSFVTPAITVTEKDTAGTSKPGQAYADFAKGDDIPFVLSATISDNANEFANYSTYKMILKNELDAGLSIKDDANGTSGVTVKYAASSTTAEENMVNITSSAIINYSGRNLTVTLNDLKSIKDSNGNEIIAAGGIVYVTYNANFSDSLVYSNNGYASALSVEYSNDPNDITSTAQTNEVSAKAFTYQLEVKNFEGAASDNKAYENAGFTLYKLNGSEETAVGDGVEKKGADLTWAGLDAGTYRLKQTTTATGYNTAEAVDFVISPTITKDSNDVYTLTAISATEVGETDSVEGFTEEVSSAKLVYTIYHTAGALFPVSGGVGTTMFYLVGGCMIVAACVALTAYRKRRLSRVIAGK